MTDSTILGTIILLQDMRLPQIDKLGEQRIVAGTYTVYENSTGSITLNGAAESAVIAKDTFNTITTKLSGVEPSVKFSPSEK